MCHESSKSKIKITSYNANRETDQCKLQEHVKHRSLKQTSLLHPILSLGNDGYRVDALGSHERDLGKEQADPRNPKPHRNGLLVRIYVCGHR